MTPGEARWRDLVAFAEARGVTADELERHVRAPARQDGCGWLFWTPARTTAVLAAYLRKWVDDRAAKGQGGGCGNDETGQLW